MSHILFLKLDRLLGAQIEKKEFEGEVVEGLWFPLKANGVLISNTVRHTLRWPLIIWKRRPNALGDTHFCSVFQTKEVYHKLKMEGRHMNLKYLGTVRDFPSCRRR